MVVREVKGGGLEERTWFRPTFPSLDSRGGVMHLRLLEGGDEFFGSS
jgi:hypothetical protein